MLEEQKAITLIALIITIIVMLILAGVTINLTLGQNGIFTAAKEAEEQYKISEYKDKVELARASVSINNMGVVTLDNLIQEIYKEKIVTENAITKLDQERARMVTEESYTFIITADKIEYLGKTDRTNMNIEISIGDISNKNVTVSINVEDNEFEIESYSLYIDNELYKTITSSNNTENITIETTFGIKKCYVVVRDKVGDKAQSNEVQIEDYSIATLDELIAFRDSVNEGNSYEGKTITQTANINLNCSETNQWVPIGKSSSMAFKGTYDGGNNNIDGIYINSTEDNKGLFGVIEYATIRNIKLYSGTVSAKKFVGGIVGSKDDGIISNCQNFATINGEEYVGGIAGLNNSSTISGCGNYGIIEGSNLYIGGISGANQYSGVIEQCNNNNTVMGGSNVGGIVGHQNTQSYVNNSYNIMSITGNSYVAGIVGNNVIAGVYSCYNKANISGNYYVGGLTGSNGAGNVVGCYSLGNATAANNYIGTISGENYEGEINYCYVISTATPNTLCQIQNGTLANSSTKTYSEMQNSSFVTLLNTARSSWKTDTGINEGYPILNWQ